MPKYLLVEETKQVPLVKLPNIKFAVKLVTCPNCNNKVNNPGKHNEYATCNKCKWVFNNPTYDGF